ncbi:CLUMA_CG009929, isoform A [Clunio marinus]|uniref:CLUMA_CG009929, isoform A n=1 Tax=Clunio marinus TaxID=568069 RepID=A0A1J1IC92_9DIPT|nr:CLUMA_CG009929, isoform A [Clunio marinus]
MVEVGNLIRFILCYTLCLVYSTWIGIGLLIAYIFKRDPNIWTVKERPTPPRALTSNEFGEHKFMRVNGYRIHYVEKGDKTKPLILFIHGFPEFWYSWRFQLNEFSKDYHVIAIDQRGYAESDKPNTISAYHFDKMVGDIRQFVQQLGREKFTLIGHDWGAVIGFRYVMRHMDTIDKYVMIGAPPSEVWHKLLFSSVKQFLMSWYVFYFQMPFLPEFTTSLQDFQMFKVMKHQTEEELEAYKYTFGKEGALTGPINYYRASAKFLFPDQPLKRPEKFAPGLYMLGEGDKYISPDSGKMAKELYDNLDFKFIKGANHFAQQHKPDETNRLIREFLEKPTPPQSLTNNEFGEHKFMTVNGIKIHYVENGDKNKPLMMFIHGFPEFWYSWRFQLNEFNKDYHVIAIDQRGYGDSDKPSKISDYHIDEMVEDIHQIIKQLGHEKFILVGHDWGAAIGFRYVIKHMETIEKYVMIGAPPKEVFDQLVTSSLKQFFMSWYMFFFQMPVLPEFFTRFYDMKSFRMMKHQTEEETEAYKYTFGKEGALTGPINYYRAGTSSQPDPPLKRPERFAPGLYMLGEFDRFISHDSGILTKELYENLDFKIIKGANHFAQQHKPDETNRLIREFMEQEI